MHTQLLLNDPQVPQTQTFQEAPHIFLQVCPSSDVPDFSKGLNPAIRA